MSDIDFRDTIIDEFPHGLRCMDCGDVIVTDRADFGVGYVCFPTGEQAATGESIAELICPACAFLRPDPEEQR